MSDESQNMNGSLPEGAATWARYKDAMNEAAGGTDHLEKKLKSLGDVVRAMGPQFTRLGDAIEGGTNPALLVTMAAVAGMDKVFEHVQKLQDQFHSLIEEGQKINGMIQNLIAARPTATQSYIELTDQLARLHEHPDRSSIADDQRIAAQRGEDQNKVDAAPDAQKPALERAVITNEIARTRATLEHDLAKGTDVDTAQRKVNQTRDDENDLKRQLEQLPGIIAALKENAANARTAAVGNLLPSAQWGEIRLQGDQKDQAAMLQAQLDKVTATFPAAAKAAADAENNFNNTRQNLEVITKLGERITTLNDNLGNFDNSRDGQKLKGQIQGLLDQNQGTGNNIREMGDKLHLSQQQLADLATRIIKQQSTVQTTIDDLHRQLDAQARQIAALPNSSR